MSAGAGVLGYIRPPAMPAPLRVPERLVGHLLAGHPWIYADAVPAMQARSGDFVALQTPSGRPLGFALHDPHSAIALRVLSTRAGERPGAALWRERVRAALALREMALDLRDTDAFRLVHGEGDRLPGVVVDAYAGYLVVKLDTPAWLPHLGDLVAALEAVVRPRGIYLKGVAGERRAGAPELGDEAKARVLAGGAPPDPIVVREHGMRLSLSIVHGQKTGLFLDQRENRALVRGYAGGRDVLNLFSYNGGFSVAAALGGATRVTSVDLAAGAIASARDSFVASGLDPERHDFVVDDVFAYLGRCAEERRSFDLVVCDPPSFAPRRQALAKALRAYARLHRLALQRVAPGGLLAAASCSSHVKMEDFLQTLREAAVAERRPLRILEVRADAADHPSYLHFPEGRYLKFVLMSAE